MTPLPCRSHPQSPLGSLDLIHKILRIYPPHPPQPPPHPPPQLDPHPPLVPPVVVVPPQLLNQPVLVVGWLTLPPVTAFVAALAMQHMQKNATITPAQHRKTTTPTIAPTTPPTDVSSSDSDALSP